jgi:site-specific DNA-adenine methylase
MVNNRVAKESCWRSNDAPSKGDKGGFQSPWNYPGSKARHWRRYLWLKQQRATTLVEPFVGGGSVFMNLGFRKSVINDADPDIAWFWAGTLVTPRDAYQNFKDAATSFELITRKRNQKTSRFIRSTLLMR